MNTDLTTQICYRLAPGSQDPKDDPINKDYCNRMQIMHRRVRQKFTSSASSYRKLSLLFLRELSKYPSMCAKNFMLKSLRKADYTRSLRIFM